MLQNGREIIINISKFFAVSDPDHWIETIILWYWLCISPFCSAPVQDTCGQVQAQKPVVLRGRHCFSCLCCHYLFLLLLLLLLLLPLGRWQLGLTRLAALCSLSNPLSGLCLASICPMVYLKKCFELLWKVCFC